jgi:hypothetical protein
MPKLFAFLVLTLALSSTQAQADPVRIGDPTDGANCFPFGCGRGTDVAATRYQQVYNRVEFTAPMVIEEIQFFKRLGSTLNTGTYSFYLSTTSRMVDGLDTQNFDLNVGMDRALFAVVRFTGGVASDVLSIAGNPFIYNPRLGNLLLDIVIPGGPINSSGEENAYFLARNGDGNGLFSRAHNFGAGFAGYGLVTRFVDSSAPVPEPATLSLLGLGLIAAAARLRRGMTTKR